MVSVMLLSSFPVLANNFDEIKEINEDVITPCDMDVSSGTYSGTGFSTSYSLKEANGENINFWIKNNGKTDVVITINGDEARTIRPGKDGHISVKAGYFSKKYTFEAVPSPSGGKINIEYRIAQRDY